MDQSARSRVAAEIGPWDGFPAVCESGRAAGRPLAAVHRRVDVHHGGCPAGDSLAGYLLTEVWRHVDVGIWFGAFGCAAVAVHGFTTAVARLPRGPRSPADAGD